MADDDDGFLSRWSRRKADLRRGTAPPEQASDPASPAPRPVTARMPSAGGPAFAPASAPAAPAATPLHPTALATGDTSAAPVPSARSAPGASPAAPPPSAAPPAPPPPTWDDVADLTPASDFSRFVRTDVEPGVRNAALKKLFAAPEFNVMDGLDIYIDDYSRPSPLSASALRGLVQAARLGLVEPEASPAGRTAGTNELTPPVQDAVAPPRPAVEPSSGPDPRTPDADPPETAPASSARLPDGGRAAAPATAPVAPLRHEDTDLRLQPHDAAGPPGAGPGTGADPGRER